MRYRKKGWQWLLTVKCATPSAGGLAQRNEWEGPGLPGEFDFSHVDDKKLRHLLESLRTELIPVFTTDFIRNAWQIEQQGGTRIELALDRGQIEANGHHEPICEVELELLDGDVAALFAAASLLQADLPLHPEVVSKAERGYRLHANAAPAPVKAPATSIDHRLTAIKAFSTVALSCLNQLQANEDGLQKSSDPEFVHQARVAIRRLRSAIRAWKPLLPAEYIDNFDPRWRILAAALGETRNHDVFISEILPSLTEAFPGCAEIDRLSRHALRRGATSRRRARCAFKTTEYSRLLLEFTAATLALPESTEPQLKPFARRCLGKRARRVSQLATAIHQTDAIARHRLRVALKRLRYALEFFATLFPGQVMCDYHLATTHLQDLLGQGNDLVVTGHFTTEMLAGRKGEYIHKWLDEKHAHLIQTIEKPMADFLERELPWKQR